MIRPLFLALSLSLSLSVHAESVSYYHQVVPIFKRSCNGCHHPGKMKADLDLTTHAGILKGGKHGLIVKLDQPAKSPLLEEISGEEPSMPKDGDPLPKSEVELIERWISQGAKDDTPEDKRNPYKLAAPPKYPAPAVISAALFSPDGEMLAVAGYHEVLLYKSDGSELVARLVGESPKIESIAFSSDGKRLAVAGGAPAVFGEIQVWNIAARKQILSRRVSLDSAFGVSFSPDDTRIAFGGADKSVRLVSIEDGRELMKFDNHSDWVFETTFTADGKRLLSGSRDRAMKLIDIVNGRLIDDINKLIEPVQCFSRHPKLDQVVYGGELGNARIYKISDNQGRTAANNDNNLLKEFERQPGPVYSVAFSPDGNHVAIGSVGSEVRIYKADGPLAATLKGHEGAIFALAWHPTRAEILTAGYEGAIRIFDPSSGRLIKSFVPFPIEKSDHVAAR
jgi:WD40 repeat protein